MTRKCPCCGLYDPTWDHVAWCARRKRMKELEYEKRIINQEREYEKQNAKSRNG